MVPKKPNSQFSLHCLCASEPTTTEQTSTPSQTNQHRWPHKDFLPGPEYLKKSYRSQKGTAVRKQNSKTNPQPNRAGHKPQNHALDKLHGEHPLGAVFGEGDGCVDQWIVGPQSRKSFHIGSFVREVALEL